MNKNYNTLIIYIFTINGLIFDKAVKYFGNDHFVNLNVFYFVTMYGFVSWFIYQEVLRYKKLKYNKDIVILKGILLINLGYILLFLSCIGQTEEVYENTVNNYIVDYVKYSFIILIFVVVLWQKLQGSSR